MVGGRRGDRISPPRVPPGAPPSCSGTHPSAPPLPLAGLPFYRQHLTVTRSPSHFCRGFPPSGPSFLSRGLLSPSSASRGAQIAGPVACPAGSLVLCPVCGLPASEDSGQAGEHGTCAWPPSPSRAGGRQLGLHKRSAPHLISLRKLKTGTAAPRFFPAPSQTPAVQGRPAQHCLPLRAKSNYPPLV